MLPLNWMVQDYYLSWVGRSDFTHMIKSPQHYFVTQQKPTSVLCGWLMQFTRVESMEESIN